MVSTQAGINWLPYIINPTGVSFQKGGKKKTLWEAFARALLWNLWLERNVRNFNKKPRDINTFIDHFSLIAVTRSNLSPLSVIALLLPSLTNGGVSCYL